MKKFLCSLLFAAPTFLLGQGMPFVTNKTDYVVLKDGAVSGGGGSITGGDCSPDFVQSLDTSGVPGCATPSVGSVGFDGITGATNTTAAMVVGTGASLGASGSGSITATAMAVGGLTGLGTGVGTWLATPSAANFASALSGQLTVPTGGTGAASFTAHGVMLGNGSSALGVTGTGTAGQVLTSNGASADPTFQAPDAVFDSTSYWYYDNWNGARSSATSSCGTSGTGFVVTNSGSGAGNGGSGTPTANNIASCYFSTGSTSSGWTNLMIGSSSGGNILFGSPTWDYRWNSELSALSTSVDTYLFRSGFGNVSSSSGAYNNGVWFSYTDTGSTPNWTINTTSLAASSSTADCGIAVSTGPHELRITVNSSAAHFYVDDVECNNSPISSNIPSSGTNYVGLAPWNLVKTGGSTGTTPVTVTPHYLYYRVTGLTRHP